MEDSLKTHYQKLFETHGNSAASVQYSDSVSQYKRFEILAAIANDLGSVVDVGCGLAHLYDYLQSTGFKGKYLGLDFVPEFVEANKKHYEKNTACSFQVFDIMKDQIPKGFDYVLLSGVFNNKMPHNRDFMFNGISKMFEACNKGMAFNAMSTYVDFQADNLYYSDPLEVFDFCKKNLSKKVCLRHDYLVKENSIPFEYAIYIYK